MYGTLTLAVLQLVVLPERRAVRRAERVHDRPVVAGRDDLHRPARDRCRSKTPFPTPARPEFASKQPMRPWNVTAQVCAPTSVGAPVTSLMRSTSVTPFGIRHRRLPVGVARLQVDRRERAAREAREHRLRRRRTSCPPTTRRLSGTARIWKIHFCSPVCALNATILPSIVRTTTRSLPTSGGETISPGALAVHNCLPSGAEHVDVALQAADRRQRAVAADARRQIVVQLDAPDVLTGLARRSSRPSRSRRRRYTASPTATGENR